jgi:hypothetical protein
MTVPPAKKNRKKGIVILAIIIIAAVILGIPPVLAGGFMVPVSKVGFGEMTGSLAATGSASANVSFVTAYEYYFLIRSRGMVQTTDSSVSSSGGTVVLTMDMKLTNPASVTTDLGNTTITGGIGTRNHTVYLSVDQGVRVSGSYTLNIYISAKVTVLGSLELNVSPIVVTATFTVS